MSTKKNDVTKSLRAALQSERELSTALRAELAFSRAELAAAVRDRAKEAARCDEVSRACVAANAENHALTARVAGIDSAEAEIHELRRGASVMRSALRAIGLLVSEFGDDSPASVVPSAQVAMTQRSALKSIGLLVSELSR